MEESSVELRLRDPLSQVTRRERRNLLGVGTLVLGIALTGLVPTKIPAFGIDFTLADQHRFLGLLAAVVGYFLAAFVIYVYSDFCSWLNAIRVAAYRETERSLEAREESASRMERAKVKEEVRLRFGRLIEMPPQVGSISVARVIFDVFIPIAVGLLAIAMVFTVDPSQQMHAGGGGPEPSASASTSSR